MSEPDLIFQISGGATPTAVAGRISQIEETIEGSKKVAWCQASGRLHDQPTILDVTVRVKIVSDYTPRSVANWVNKRLCELAYGPQFFTADRPGIVSLIEPIELLPTTR